MVVGKDAPEHAFVVLGEVVSRFGKHQMRTGSPPFSHHLIYCNVYKG